MPNTGILKSSQYNNNRTYTTDQKIVNTHIADDSFQFPV